jgi:hypothetical protein
MSSSSSSSSSSSAPPNPPPTSLLDIDPDVFISILSSWITIEDVAHLDSALCCKRFRSYFLHTLRRPYCGLNSLDLLLHIDVDDPYNGEASRRLRGNIFKWLDKRSVSLRDLEIPFTSALQKWTPDMYHQFQSDIFDSTRFLRSLSVGGLQGGPRAFLEEMFFSFVQRNKRTLESIECSIYPIQSWAVVAEIAKCTQLKSLVLNTGGSTPSTFGGFVSSPTSALNHAIRKIMLSCKTIEALKFIPQCGSVINHSTLLLLSRLPCLTSLELVHKYLSASWVNGSAFQIIAQSCRHLRKLFLYGSQFEERSFVELVKKCIHLVTLKVASNGLVNMDVLLTNATLDAIATSLSNLEFLSLEGDTTWITDASVIPLVVSCPKLTHLSLHSGGAHTTLRDGGRMHHVTNKSLAYIGAHCKNMRYLKFGEGECGRSISALALLNLADACPRLRIFFGVERLVRVRI